MGGSRRHDPVRDQEARDLLPCLVAFAGKWKIDLPKEPPTLNYFTLRPIVDGKRDEAERAVAACEDLKLLRTAMRAGLMAPWRKAAVQKRIEELEAAGNKAKAPARAGKAKAPARKRGMAGKAKRGGK